MGSIINNVNLFYEKLENVFNSGKVIYGKNICQDGFFNIDKDLVKKVISTPALIEINGNKKEIFIKWGGRYSSSSKDFMHFEIKPGNNDKTDRSDQIFLESLDLKTIKEELNKYKDPNGKNYKY